MTQHVEHSFRDLRIHESIPDLSCRIDSVGVARVDVTAVITSCWKGHKFSKVSVVSVHMWTFIRKCWWQVLVFVADKLRMVFSSCLYDLVENDLCN